jgi:hypothetical protein
MICPTVVNLTQQPAQAQPGAGPVIGSELATLPSLPHASWVGLRRRRGGTFMRTITVPRFAWWIIAVLLLFVLILVIHMLGGFSVHFAWLHIGISGK